MYKSTAWATITLCSSLPHPTSDSIETASTDRAMKIVGISFLAFFELIDLWCLVAACLHSMSQRRAGKRNMGVEIEEITVQRTSPDVEGDPQPLPTRLATTHTGGAVVEGGLSGPGDWVDDRESKITVKDNGTKVEKGEWEHVQSGKKSEEWENGDMAEKQAKPWSPI